MRTWDDFVRSGADARTSVIVAPTITGRMSCAEPNFSQGSPEAKPLVEQVKILREALSAHAECCTRLADILGVPTTSTRGPGTDDPAAGPPALFGALSPIMTLYSRVNACTHLVQEAARKIVGG